MKDKNIIQKIVSKMDHSNGKYVNENFVNSLKALIREEIIKEFALLKETTQMIKESIDELYFIHTQSSDRFVKLTQENKAILERMEQEVSRHIKKLEEPVIGTDEEYQKEHDNRPVNNADEQSEESNE